MTAGSGARVHRFDRRNVERAMASRQQPAAEIGILPVEKNPSSKPPTCSNADRRIITQAPDTQSTSTGSDARDQSRLRFESQLSGAILVRKLMRPPRPVVTSGNRRADGHAPVGVQDAWSDDGDVRVQVQPGREGINQPGPGDRVRIQQEEISARRFARAAVHARGEASFRRFSMSVMFADCDFTAAARAESPS